MVSHLNMQKVFDTFCHSILHFQHPYFEIPSEQASIYCRNNFVPCATAFSVVFTFDILLVYFLLKCCFGKNVIELEVEPLTDDEVQEDGVPLTKRLKRFFRIGSIWCGVLDCGDESFPLEFSIKQFNKNSIKGKRRDLKGRGYVQKTISSTITMLNNNKLTYRDQDFYLETEFDLETQKENNKMIGIGSFQGKSGNFTLLRTYRPRDYSSPLLTKTRARFEDYTARSQRVIEYVSKRTLEQISGKNVLKNEKSNRSRA